MKDAPIVTIDFDKKCSLCKKAGATAGGLCLTCINKKILAGDYDHIIKRKQGVN